MCLTFSSEQRSSKEGEVDLKAAKGRKSAQEDEGEER